MSTTVARPVQVRKERVISATPEVVYNFLADYSRRPMILPPNYIDYHIEQGGFGAGTVIAYRLEAAGRERPYSIRVEEPAPGTLVERDINSSLVTIWQLLPMGNGRYTKVVLTTQWEGSSGTGGFFERTFAPMGLGRVHDTTLDLLTGIVQNPQEVYDNKQGWSVWAGRLVLMAGAATLAGIAGVLMKQRRR
jgi:hypothetical protein